MRIAAVAREKGDVSTSPSTKTASSPSPSDDRSDVIALPPLILAKPAFGAPCNRCGWCCSASACAIAIKHVPGAREDEPCPALEFQDSVARCGMVTRPGHYLGLPHSWADEDLGATVARELGKGRGCDAAILEEGP